MDAVDTFFAAAESGKDMPVAFAVWDHSEDAPGLAAVGLVLEHPEALRMAYSQNSKERAACAVLAIDYVRAAVRKNHDDLEIL